MNQVEFEIRSDLLGRFWVGHEDRNGEWWDADLEGFDTLEEAQAFLAEVDQMQKDAA
jgi:hypothetical protein